MMKSPFSGMDPFLEEPAEWSGVHTRLINSISDYLVEQITPNFSVKIETRVYITEQDDSSQLAVAPDLYITHHPASSMPLSSTATAVAEITEPALLEPLFELDRRERYIEIHDRRNNEVITTIEILSPYSKVLRPDGHQAFMKKRRKIIATDAHWIEIDLLRKGERPAEIKGKSDYYSLLKRGGTFGPFEVWYTDLRDRLPVIAIPLREPFGDVPLDLQEMLEDVYFRGRYAYDLDYMGKIPSPKLRPADENWVRAQIASWQTANGESL